MTEDEQYYLVTRANLLRDAADPSSLAEIRELVSGHLIERVLDIGCGIGQALFPLAVRNGAEGFGVDISDLSLRMGREFYAENMPDAKITFMNARAEALPFAANSFDLVNFGLALPYTQNARAIAEVARVMRPGGLFLLKIHHARYYFRELRNGIASASLPSVVHGSRVLAAGTMYHLSGRQPRVRFLNESYQTRWLLKRELRRQGMYIENEMPNGDRSAPAFVIRKHSEKR